MVSNTTSPPATAVLVASDAVSVPPLVLETSCAVIHTTSTDPATGCCARVRATLPVASTVGEAKVSSCSVWYSYEAEISAPGSGMDVGRRKTEPEG